MSLMLRGIDFGPVFNPGTRNLGGEGWPHQECYEYIPGYDLWTPGFKSKSFTVPARMPKREDLGKGNGNMVLDPVTFQPVDRMPDCIKIYVLSGDVLNAIGLVNPGIEAYLKTGRLQAMSRPIILSYAPMGKNKAERIEDARQFAKIVGKYLHEFKAPVAIEINDSCPNTENDPVESAEDSVSILRETYVLGIPQGIKYNSLVEIQTMLQVSESGYCDFLTLPNSMPFGKRPDVIPWVKRFGYKSPLEKYGGGGYSCRENFLLAVEKVKGYRRAGGASQVVLGAVFSKKDVRIAAEAGADAVEYSRMAITRPHRCGGVNREAYRLFGGKKWMR